MFFPKTQKVQLELKIVHFRIASNMKNSTEIPNKFLKI